MTAVSLDTLAIARRLKAAGFSEDQAEAVTGVLREARQADLSVLATKSDLREVEQGLKADLREVEHALRSEIGTMKADIRSVEQTTRTLIEAAKAETIKWVLSAIGFQAIVIVGAIVALSRRVP